MVTEIKANAWTLQSGDKITRGIYGDCVVVRTESDRPGILKGTTRVYYTRDSDFLHCFDINHNRPFTIIPANV